MNTKQVILLYCSFFVFTLTGYSQIQKGGVLNEPLDISKNFYDYTNTFYFADELVSFDGKTGEGKIRYRRYQFKTRQAFNNMLMKPDSVEANEFPDTEYEASPELAFKVEFPSLRTIRLKAISGPQYTQAVDSLMFVNGEPENKINLWKFEEIDGGYAYKSEFGSVKLYTKPWRIEIADKDGKILTHTLHNEDFENTYTPVLPFSYVRNNSDYSRNMAAVFSLNPGEKIFGTGESFTPFNKRGQKVVLYTDDANGVQNETMYKPIPFYMSSRGYGVFMHTSAPITVDFGKYFNGANSMMLGDDELDLFFFIGKPKEILDEYTNITGKAKMPPLWSFGLWMSRITYFSEKEGREVAQNLRKNKIPSDVIHFDTGWFDVDWRNNYEFSSSRFDDPKKMLSDLGKEGFHVSLWQLPYFSPKNSLFKEIVENDLAVKDKKGNLSYEDAVLDFSNPQTIKWYQKKIRDLLKLGVSAIKVDFGEAAPLEGIYKSGRTGFYEHNLYPLRYNKAVADITEREKDYSLIWARSAWAGSQRYPLHWGGDAATTNTAMASTLRGGLSLGISGFTFWSHDLGGFTTPSPENLYRRWTPFGMLSSHVRSHGEPPTEPWLLSEGFLNDFRKADNLRYTLMPYIYAQAKASSDKGLPMLRALFIEFPEDPGAWQIDDEYLFGENLLVAPLFEDAQERKVYLPGGKWIDYQTGKVYDQGWHTIKSGEIPILLLVRNGSVIPHIELAQSTQDMDWSTINLKVYLDNNKTEASGKIFVPNTEDYSELQVERTSDGLRLVKNPYQQEGVKFSVESIFKN